jgi:hypothetical protein
MAFAESIAQQINRDDEVGHTNGGKFLDEMIQKSIDDGNPYIELPNGALSNEGQAHE